jgi:two-component sensor histidine kinase/ActR/RegA family two-component response regulator
MKPLTDRLRWSRPADMSSGKSRPIRSWLFGLSFLSCLPLIVFSIWLIFHNAESNRARVLTRIQDTTRAMIHAVDERFESRIALLQGLATSAALRDGRLDEFRMRADEVLADLPAGSIIIVADRSGRQLLNTLTAPGAPLPQRTAADVARQVFETRKPVVSNVIRGAVSGRLFVSIDVPVTANGEVIYDLALGMPLQELTQLLVEQKIPATWYAGVIDRNGVLGARLPDPELFVGKPAAPALREGIRQSAEGRVETPTLDNVEVVSTWSRSQDHGWSVAVAIPKSEILAPLQFQLAIWFASGLLTLALSAALALMFGRPIAVRLATLADRAGAIASGRASRRPQGGITEIDAVNTAMENANKRIREQEQHLRLLIAELDHRVKNMLTSVQAIASRTLAGSPERAVFSGRLAALANAHSLLSKTQGRGSWLRPLVEAALAAHRDVAGRVQIAGPDLFLTPRVTQGIALTLHELTTNSVKYGSLSASPGSVRIEWSVVEGSEPRLLLRWSEHDGPPVIAPAERGFGSVLIEKTVSVELDGSANLEFLPQGVVFTLDIALRDAVGDPVPAMDTTSQAPITPSLARGSRILLVEDEPLAAMQVVEILSQAGLKVHLVSNVEKAEQVAVAERFDAAVLDVNVNGEMAFPIARALKRQGTPLLFLTGYDIPEIWPADLRDALRLSKPVNASELYDALGIRHDAPSRPEPAQSRATVH